MKTEIKIMLARFVAIVEAKSIWWFFYFTSKSGAEARKRLSKWLLK